MATKRQLIKRDLLQQLEDKGIVGKHYIDLIDDYMVLFDLKNELAKKIKELGAMVEWQNGQHQKGYKKNDAVSELPKVNKQMLFLLKELGLQATPVEGDDDDVPEDI
jgi:ribosomal protein S19E (S16A)